MADIKFGTDGWRAIIAEDFTFTNVRRVAQASADYWNANPVQGTEQTVIVGYDRRFLSDRFARCASEVLADNGLKIILTPAPTPTPAVSFSVKSRRAVGGVMITASHNPPAFNGYKLKAHYGSSADSTCCNAVERQLDQSPVRWQPWEQCAKDGLIDQEDLCPPYYRAIKHLVDFRLIARSKIRLAHDALFGVGAGCFENLLARTTCQVTTLNGAHDPNFGGLNPEPISRNYRPSAAFLKKHPHDLCVVTDGDADRIGGMDGRGNPISTHRIICLLLQHFVRHRDRSGRVIKAITTTSMVDKMCAAYSLPLVETAVGFKHIATEMLKGDVLLGFEESGGIGFPGHIPERDGVLAGMMLLEMLATEKKPINHLINMLERQFGPHRYARLDTHCPIDKCELLMDICRRNPPLKLLKSPVAGVKSSDGIKFVAENGSWLMLRGSGTEPVLRVYAEAASDADAARLLSMGVGLTRKV